MTHPSTVTVTLHPDLIDDVTGYAEAKGLTLQTAVDRLLSTGLTRAAAVARYEATAKGRATQARSHASRPSRRRRPLT